MKSDTFLIWVIDDAEGETEIEVLVMYRYHFDPGVYSGPMEGSYPAEEELEILDVEICVTPDCADPHRWVKPQGHVAEMLYDWLEADRQQEEIREAAISSVRQSEEDFYQ